MELWALKETEHTFYVRTWKNKRAKLNISQFFFVPDCSYQNQLTPNKQKLTPAPALRQSDTYAGCVGRTNYLDAWCFSPCALISAFFDHNKKENWKNRECSIQQLRRTRVEFMHCTPTTKKVCIVRPSFIWTNPFTKRLLRMGHLGGSLCFSLSSALLQKL